MSDTDLHAQAFARRQEINERCMAIRVGICKEHGPMPLLPWQMPFCPQCDAVLKRVTRGDGNAS